VEISVAQDVSNIAQDALLFLVRTPCWTDVDFQLWKIAFRIGKFLPWNSVKGSELFFL